MLTPKAKIFLLAMKFSLLMFFLGAGLLVTSLNASACNFGNNGEVSGGCGLISGPAGPDTGPSGPPCKCRVDGECKPCPEGCDKPQTAQGGDPIDVFSGRQVLSITDLRVTGVKPIIVVRSYDSITTYDSPLGFGWAINIDRRLYKYADNSVIIRTGCGSRTKFLFVGGAYKTPTDVPNSTLTENADGSFVHTFTNGSKDFFDSQGKIVAEQDLQGNRLEYSYDTRGRLPLIGSSPYSITPNVPAVSTYDYRLLKVEERLAAGTLSGQSVTLTYNDTNGRLQKIAANDGREVVYTHDQTTSAKNGNLINVKDVSGINSVYQYNAPGDAHNITSMQDGANAPYINEYYPLVDKVKKQTHSGDVFEFTYVTALQAVVTHKVYNPLGTQLLSTEVITYTFDASGFIKIAEFALDGTLFYKTEYIFNASTGLYNEAIQSEKPGASGTYVAVNNTKFTHDGRGHKTSEITTLATGEIITKTWAYAVDALMSEQVVSSLAPTKIFRTEYTYFLDANGIATNRKEIKQRRDDGSFQITSFTYDANGNMASQTSPTGLVTKYTYTNNKLTQTQLWVSGVALPQLKTNYGYDAYGNVNSITDAKTQTTNVVFDVQQRPIQITNALAQINYQRHTENNVTEEERGATAAGGAGQVRQFSYTAQGWLNGVKEKKDDGTFQTVYAATFNSDGKELTSVSFRNGTAYTTTYVYDAQGRLTRETDSGSNATQYAYDMFGNVKQITDAKNRITVYTYDALSRLIKTENKGVTPSAITTMSYDAAGNLVSITDPENKTTTYAYDALSRQTLVTQPLGQITKYVYDTTGELKYKLDARGLKTSYLYYAWGPIYRVEYYPSETSTTLTKRVEYAYDNNANLLSVIDNTLSATPIYTFTYDALNRVNATTAKYIAGVDIVTTNTYDRYGNRSRFTLQDTATVQSDFTYNKLNQLSAIALAGTQNFTPTYFTDAGLIQKLTYPSAMTSENTFDNAGALASITIKNTSATVDALTYSYTNGMTISNINSTRDGGGHAYIYDGLDQLTQVTHPAGFGVANETYQYDKVGNRDLPSDATIYQYDNNHRITQSPGLLQYTYDAAGNQTGRSDGVVMTYDTDNRLLSYTKGTTSATYLYDPFGRRIKKTVNGAVTFYAWDGAKLSAEYSATGVRQKRYAYLPDSSNPIQMQDANGTYNVHSDHLGTARFLTNSTQQIVWSSKQAAFGDMVANEDPDANGTNVIYNPRFAGQYADKESGLYYNYSRDYDPSIGRYIESDPIGLAGGINLYLYALGNPNRYTDWNGQSPQDSFLIDPKTGKPIPHINPHDNPNLKPEIQPLPKPTPNIPGRPSCNTVYSLCFAKCITKKLCKLPGVAGKAAKAGCVAGCGVAYLICRSAGGDD
ncbi:MAG: RHS repeat-associated core domain-containing protein [Pseudomonadota bacterium]